jgi:hypothetical protein
MIREQQQQQFDYRDLATDMVKKANFIEIHFNLINDQFFNNHK